MDIPALKNEIDTDPLARGYAGMTDIQVADDMNLSNRRGLVGIADMLKFLLLDNVYSTDGDDTEARSIWQRMKEVVSMAAVPVSPGSANPWGSTSIGNITEIQQIRTHQLLSFFTLSAQGSLVVDIEDSNFQGYLTGAQAAGCMSVSQKNDFLALADNLQSRGEELSLGKIREGHIQKARL